MSRGRIRMRDKETASSLKIHNCAVSVMKHVICNIYAHRISLYSLTSQSLFQNAVDTRMLIEILIQVAKRAEVGLQMPALPGDKKGAQRPE